jgi:hypothetical protein
MLSQTAGSAATMAMGQSAMMRTTQAGTQESALRSAGETQETVGTMQMGMGSLNAAVGLLQVTQAMKHRRHGNSIVGEANGSGLQVEKATAANSQNEYAQTQGEAGWISGAGVNQKIIRNFKMNEQSGAVMATVNAADHPTDVALKLQDRNHQGERLKNIIGGRIRDVANDAQSEQKMAQNAAMGGAMMSIMTGAQQMMSGTMSMMAGKRLQKAADALKNNTTTPAPPVLAPTLPGNLTGNSQIAAAPGAVSASANTDQNQAEATEEIDDAAPPEVGGGFNPAPLPSGIMNPVAPGKYNPGAGPGGPGGGGGGIGGGGSTSAAQGGQEDNQAKLAPKGDGSNYESGGGAFMSGGNGGGKGPDGNTDLSSLLGQLLPKKEDANQPGNSILEFGERGPQTDASSVALPREANLFTEISKTIVGKVNQGNIWADGNGTQ